MIRLCLFFCIRSYIHCISFIYKLQQICNKKEWNFRKLVVPQTFRFLVVLRIRPHSHPMSKDGLRPAWAFPFGKPVSTFMLAAGEAIYAPARKSLIPTLVKKENIIKINSLEQVMLGVVLIISAFSGGIVTYFFGPNITFWLNGLFFLFAALIIFSLPQVDENRQIQKNRDAPFFQSINTIKKLITVSSPLLIAILFELVVPLFNGIDNVLISLYAVQEFKLGDIGVGLFYGALGIGLMLSYIISQHIQKHLLFIGLVSLIVEGVFHIFLSHVYLPTFHSHHDLHFDFFCIWHM